MFHAASLMLLNKVDLLPHLGFDVDRCIEYARRINPALELMQVSAVSGEGLDAWTGWLMAGLERATVARRDSVARLKQRIAELEAQLAAKG
jgi:hydrogenase nickel incorporation protein HypB